MNRPVSPLNARARAVRGAPLAQLRELFDPWLRLPDTFGRPARDRLFSPLKGLLALSCTGPCA